MTPRSVRNNNPGNIDRTAVVWQGEDRSAAALEREPRFCVFLTPAQGFRAIAKTLQTYSDKYGLNTVRGIITRWAPGHENDTAAYIAAVAKSAGISPDAAVNVRSIVEVGPIVRAIAHHEAGGDYWDRMDSFSGMSLAGCR